MAKKPVIYAGQGVIALPEGPKLLAELAEKCKIPVTTTVHGLGGFDELNDLSLHMLGMHVGILLELFLLVFECYLSHYSRDMARKVMVIW